MERAWKAYRNGTDRTISPGETLRRARPHWGKLGITRLANVTGLDSIGIPVVMSVRPNSRGLSVSQGKGLDLAAAKASALMESIESYHAERIDHPLKLASYNELRTRYPVVDPETLQWAPGSQFHGDLPLLWIEGRLWPSEESLWVPHELVHTAYLRHPHFEPRTFYATSNGLASGNHKLEAITHALCEVIERDEWARGDASLADSGTNSCAVVDLETIDDPACRSVIEAFESAGIDTVIQDLTGPTGVPVYACSIQARPDGRLLRTIPAVGTGAHTTRRIALLRALTEAAQSRLTYIAGSRDDIRWESYESETSQDPAPRPDLHGPRCSFAQAPNYEADTFEDDLHWLTTQLASRDLHQIVVVDLSIEEFPWSVVRVLVPGTRQSMED